MRLKLESPLDDESELRTDLTFGDIGRTWWIGFDWFIWTGETWLRAIASHEVPGQDTVVKDVKRNRYLTAVYEQMLDDLFYPVAKDGAVMDASGIKAWVCWHLVRAGWRKPNNTDGLFLIEDYDDPVIKKRKVYGPGVFEDAVTWVDFNDPDDPLAHLDDMTMGQIEALPDDVKLEAKRRLGLTPPADEQPPLEPAWSVQPFISIIDAPDEDTEWTN